ncbi:hydroxysteroid dehydrogenase-like protein 2 [Patella vulgata]|uniref:hydroxysteroid dehydrogenase-like protein 2 n=1 Tax=Patella vulgata TaxID=6465 RepID=UPI0024A907FE|nr:hydroxysteroid dehydrogenase-like protein 2 [Patella vulgata]XP_050397882.2 hydroxysteroid dehydrogenase-like protein 2 [Patella vulgata]
MKTALVIGASRGIGRQIALTLAKNGYNICVAAKTTEDSDKLPGSIHTVTKEIQESGGNAIPVQCNARSENEIRQTVKTCINHFGGLDVAVYNAGAILWNKIMETPFKRFELLLDVNLRGAYVMLEEVLAYFTKKNSGKVIMVSPPIYSRFFKGKTPYSVSKMGVSILVQGLGIELKDTGVAVTSLWPATAIRSHVTDVMGLDKKIMRTPDIFADACLNIAQEESNRLNGQCLIDEDYLRSVGITDFAQYRCDPEHEPPRMMPRKFPSLKVAEEEEVTAKL